MQGLTAGVRLQVSQRDGRDLDPEHKMWLTYMKKRRAQGAGTYTAREMKEEFERVAATLESAAAGGPAETTPCALARPLCQVS